jgi:hypothetical protein
MVEIFVSFRELPVPWRVADGLPATARRQAEIEQGKTIGRDHSLNDPERPGQAWAGGP